MTPIGLRKSLSTERSGEQSSAYMLVLLWPNGYESGTKDLHQLLLPAYAAKVPWPE
jgi:hypothetical protein